MSNDAQRQLDAFIARYSPEAAALDRAVLAEIHALIEQTLDHAAPPLDPAHTGGLVIKSVSASRCPRRPA